MYCVWATQDERLAGLQTEFAQFVVITLAILLEQQH